MELVNPELCGPFEVSSVGGYSYFLTFINDFKKETQVCLLKEKFEVYENLNKVNLFDNQCNLKSKTLRIDRGIEYFTRDDFLNANGKSTN